MIMLSIPSLKYIDFSGVNMFSADLAEALSRAKQTIRVIGKNHLIKNNFL